MLLLLQLLPPALSLLENLLLGTMDITLDPQTVLFPMTLTCITRMKTYSSNGSIVINMTLAGT